MKRLPDDEFKISVERRGINNIVSVLVEHMPTGATGWDESRSQLDATTRARGRAEERAVSLMPK